MKSILQPLLSLSFSLLSTTLVFSQIQPPTNLHDSVPYQGHPLLYNAVTIEHQDEEELREECDWPQMMRMIRDIEAKLSVALEEEVHRNYTLDEIIGSRVYKQFNCNALRDSIIALQIELDEALESEPTAMSLAAVEIASTLARLKGRILDDGNLPLGAIGFLYGTDSTLTDSINVPFGPLQAIFDTSEVDTASFDIQVTGLTRYTQYYFTAVGSNEEGAGYGDTLSFMTPPELATGLVVDTSGVTATQALLKLSIADDGGQGPDSVGFFWHITDFNASTLGVDSLPSDSSGGTNHSVLATGLTRYTDYFVNAYADNMAGRAVVASNFTFKTLPELPTFLSLAYLNERDTLHAILDDDGGQTPIAVAFEYADNATLTSASAVTAALIGDSIYGQLLENVLLGGKKYYVAASAQNNSGIGRSDTVAFYTRVQIDPLVVTNPSTTLGEISYNGSYTWDDAAPTNTGVLWAYASDLSGATTASTSPGAGGAYSGNLNTLTHGSYIYLLPFATNIAGTNYGDTVFQATLPNVLTLDATYLNGQTVALNGKAEYGNAVPSATDFLFGYQADLSDGTSQVSTLESDSTWSYQKTLAPGTIAYFTARATNAGGQQTGSTKQVVSLTAISVNPAENITNNEASLSASFEYNNAVPDSVGIIYSTDPTMSSPTGMPATMNADSTVSVDVPGLTRYTDYYFTVFAGYNGLTGYGDTVSFKTLPDIPVLNLTFDLHADELNSKVTDPGGVVPDSVYFKWSRFANLSDPIDSVVVYNAIDSTFSAVIDVLSGSDYYAAAYAANAAGTGISDTLHFATKLEVTTNPALANATDTTAVLQGSVFYRTQFAEPDSIGFRITHEGISTDHWFSADQMQADSTFAFEFDFNFEEEYAFRAIAKNAHDGTSVGEEIIFCAGSCPEQLSYRGVDYGVVRIGCHCYFSNNLATLTYVNGDSILRVTNDLTGANYNTFYEALEIGALRDLGNDSITQSIGYHYNVALVGYDYQSINRKVCPPGWHIMSMDDYSYITPYVNTAPYALRFDNDPAISSQERNFAQIDALKASSEDTPPFDGTNQFGFSVIPNGRINSVGDLTNTDRGTLLFQGGFGAGDFDFMANPLNGNNYNAFNRSADGFFKNDGGAIRCVADDQPSAPFIYSANATETSSTSAVLHGWLGFVGWETSSIPAVLDEIGFVVSADESFSDSTIYPTSLLAGDSIELQLTGLTDGQEYWFKTYATNEFGTALSTTRSFIAMTATAPTVTTLPISHMVTEEWGKSYFTTNGKLNSKNNGEVLSAGWKWSTNADLSDAVDSVQVANYHSEVEDLVLNLDTVFSVEIDQETHLPSHYSMQPGETYYYTAFVTNEHGTGYGDTLNHYVPMAVRSSAVEHTDSTVTISGSVKYGDTPPTSMSLVWSYTPSDDLRLGKENFSLDFISKYDSLCAAQNYVPTGDCLGFEAQDLYTVNEVGYFHDLQGFNVYDQTYLTYETRLTFTSPTDTMAVALQSDSTFSVTIAIDDSVSLETPLNWQLVYTNAAGTYRSGMQGTTTGGCFDVEAEGFTYHLVKIGSKCWFAEDLRTESYEDGSSIPYLAWPDSGDVAKQTAWVEARQNGGAQSFKDSISLAQDGRVYTIGALIGGNVCPAGTRIPTIDEARKYLDETDGDYLMNSGGNIWSQESHIGRDIFEYNGPGRSGISFSDSLWVVDGLLNDVLEGESTEPAYWASPKWSQYYQSYSGYEFKFKRTYTGFIEGEHVAEWDEVSLIAANQKDNSANPVRCIADNNLQGPSAVAVDPTGVSDSTITLNAVISFPGWRGATQTGFMYDFSPSFSGATTTWGTDVDGEFSLSLTGLSGGTVYYRPVAQGPDGIVSYGPVESQCLINCSPVTYNGDTYQTTIVGCDCWFAEDLVTSKYNDGTDILQPDYNCGVGTDICWGDMPSGGSTDTSAAYRVSYGGSIYYTLNAAANSTNGGICPTGWSIPSSTDWEGVMNMQTLSGEELWAPEDFNASSTGYIWDGFGAGFNFVSADSAFYWADLSYGSSSTAIFFSDQASSYGSIQFDRWYATPLRCMKDDPSAPNIVTLPTDPAVTTDSTATLLGSVVFDGWSSVTATGFKWGLLPDLSDGAIVPGDTLAGDFSADLTDLVSGDTIYYAAYATNALGTSYGDTLSTTIVGGITATWSILGSGEFFGVVFVSSAHTGSTAPGFGISSPEGTTGITQVEWGDGLSSFDFNMGFPASLLPQVSGPVTLTAFSGESITFTPATITLNLTCSCGVDFFSYPEAASQTNEADCDAYNGDWNCSW